MIKKYRVIEENIEGKIHYTVQVQRKGWVFTTWDYLTTGPESDIATFDAMDEIKKAIEADSIGRTSRVVKEIEVEIDC